MSCLSSKTQDQQCMSLLDPSDSNPLFLHIFKCFRFLFKNYFSLLIWVCKCFLIYYNGKSIVLEWLLLGDVFMIACTYVCIYIHTSLLSNLLLPLSAEMWIPQLLLEIISDFLWFYFKGSSLHVVLCWCSWPFTNYCLQVRKNGSPVNWRTNSTLGSDSASLAPWGSLMRCYSHFSFLSCFVGFVFLWCFLFCFVFPTLLGLLAVLLVIRKWSVQHIYTMMSDEISRTFCHMH